LARLLHAGVPLTEALDTLAATLPAGRVRAALEAGGAGLRDGEDLSQVLARHRLLDREFVQLLSVGERSGELPTMLERLGDRYQRAASRGFQRLAAWLEPMAIVVLAVLIGGIALAAALLMMEIGVV
jgi:type II secretory pathway component PulF